MNIYRVAARAVGRSFDCLNSRGPGIWHI